MDNSKVTLPRDVAEAIEYFREKGHTDAYIVSRSVVGGVGGHEISLVNFDKDALMSALVNGYTIEQTPEEKVREYYDELYAEVNNGSFSPIREKAAELCGLERTLDLLGIKIEGVNA